MKNRFSGVFGCVGAIIGAGFVSGREVVSFFSRYGIHSWWLIGLAVATMVVLCCLCMHRAVNGGERAVCCPERPLARWCLLTVLVVLAGSMTAAAGHMVALLLPVKAAYLLGIVATLSIAWLLSNGSMKPFSALSFTLTGLFLAVILLALRTPSAHALDMAEGTSPVGLAKAALYAVGYGAMNIAVSMGVICRSGQGCGRDRNRKSALLGLMLCGLLFVSNALYLRNPQVQDNAFPIVPFAAGLGRAGYVLCLAMLYLAVLTTLIALVLVVRNGLEQASLPGKAVMPLTLGLPAVISGIGFADIVDHLYAPCGLFCLLILFFPMFLQSRQKPS